jgi:hypothetical protein
MMNLKKRLAALEKGLNAEPTILWMPDGSSCCISGNNDHILRLVATVFGGATPEQELELDLIRRSDSIQEAGGGHMLELLRAILLSPVSEVT